MGKSLVFVLLLCCGVLLVAQYFDPLGNGLDPEVDHELREEIRQWKLAMDEAGIEYDAGFKRLDYVLIIPNMQGRVGLSSKGDRSIFIDSATHAKGFYTSRGIVWHELGHYVFGLNHTDDSLSIMFKNIQPNNNMYKENWGEMKKKYIEYCKNQEWNGKY